MSSILPYVITTACVDVKDQACLRVCPVDCIYGHPEEPQLFIHPEECIDCGSCEMVCPVTAIYRIDEVPETEQAAIADNAAFFERRPDYLKHHKTSWE